jgi:hypothetical protein
VKRLCVVSVVGALSCGAGFAPDYVSKSGVTYEWSGQDTAARWTPAEIEAEESAFLLGTTGLGSKVPDVLSHAVVILYAKKFECGASSVSGFCHGLQEGPQLSVTDMGCPSTSALAHELLHWTFEGVRGFPDPLHTDPLWPVVDVSSACPEVP